MTEVPRVLCVTPMYPEPRDPAFGSFVWRLNATLVEAGHAAIDVVHRPPERRGALSYAQLLLSGLRQIAKRRDYDLVHAHYLGVGALVALVLALLLRRPLVLTAHGDDVGTEATSRLAKLGLRGLVARSAGLHLVSHALRQRAEQTLGELPPHVLVQPTGVDLTLFRPASPSPRPAGTPFRILIVAMLLPAKGWASAIEALRVLRSQGVAAVLHGYGAGDPHWIEAQAERFGVADIVHLFGVRPPNEMPAIYREADVLAVPSEREGFGLAGLEAMACGTPVVATGVGGMGDYMLDEVNALLVPLHAPGALAEAIARVLSNRLLRDRLVAAGIETARRYDSTLAARAVGDFYRQVIASHRR